MGKPCIFHVKFLQSSLLGQCVLPSIVAMGLAGRKVQFSIAKNVTWIPSLDWWATSFHMPFRAMFIFYMLISWSICCFYSGRLLGKMGGFISLCDDLVWIMRQGLCTQQVLLSASKVLTLSKFKVWTRRKYILYPFNIVGLLQHVSPTNV